jgi:hypothetical protein
VEQAETQLRVAVQIEEGEVYKNISRYSALWISKLSDKIDDKPCQDILCPRHCSYMTFVEYFLQGYHYTNLQDYHYTNLISFRNKGKRYHIRVFNYVPRHEEQSF